MSIKVWSEKVVIPTYEIGAPEKNPIFLEKRVYQGSSGSVYPHPVIEKISDEKVDKEWQACYLENDYLKIMILPELGGRIQMAYDKVKERHFVYYNEVIKPALVGLTGPWISGGIEFNWPQHHRPSTYDKVDFSIEENADGSVTVWCSEIERMFRTKGMTGFTIYPDKAYLEINAKLYNRTSQPQTFLWWANPAVAVNDDYQSVFPPDVNAVFDHGKRDVSEFPIAKGTYYKMDYSPGTDISLYKNIPVPTSYMAIKSDYNFVGGYENDSRGGLLHIANHHVSPGKKQWTWGHGDFGQAWDRNLTDQNGPYIELMCGVYTDNQPDFSWIMPYEEKAFSQYFMPYAEVGVMKNASKDVMINLDVQGEKATVKVYSTGFLPNAKIQLEANGKTFLSETFSFEPSTTFLTEVAIDASIANHEYTISVISEKGKVILDWSYPSGEPNEIPDAATEALNPKDIKSNEELFLNGLHIEQYRHATYNPTDYYLEALERDPNDIRCNNAMGMYYFRKGQFAKAEGYFRTAYETQLQRNPNPYDGEPLFNLGLALRFQNKDEEAYEYFYKSVWNAAYMDSGYFQVSQIDATNEEWTQALDTVDRSLIRNWHNHKARLLKTSILRKMGAAEKAEALIKDSLELDKFNFGLYFEKYLLGDSSALDTMKHLLRNNIHNYIEVSLDYAAAGMYAEAVELIQVGIDVQQSVYPMAYIYKAWFLSKAGDTTAAKEALKASEKCAPDYCFPNRIEAVPALQLAMELNPEGSYAPYYLGNFWYAARQYEEALACWEKSAELNDQFPTVLRNLALAYYNKFNRTEEAVVILEKAFNLTQEDPRILLELDQLYKKLNKSVVERLEILDKYFNLVEQRDDLYVEFMYVLILNKQYQRAYDLIMSRQFHPWEGGEGKVTGAYVAALVALSRAAIANNEGQKALELLTSAKSFPHNLGEGKLDGTLENQLDYWIGCAYESLGNSQEAKENWTKASVGMVEPEAAWFYNDQQPDTIFYQGLALLKLGQEQEANTRFQKLIDYGQQHLEDDIKIDYFAVSLPDLTVWDADLNKINQISCYYLMSLGYKGQGNGTAADEHANQVKGLDNAHLGIGENKEVEFLVAN